MPISFDPDTLEAVYTPYKYEHLSFLGRGNIDALEATPQQSAIIQEQFWKAHEVEDRTRRAVMWPGLARELSSLYSRQKEKP